MRPTGAVVVLAVLVPATAAADPDRVATVVVDGPPGSIEVDEPRPPPPPPEAASTKAIEARRAQASSSRGFFTGTALTVPEGHGELSTRIGEVGVLTTIALGSPAAPRSGPMVVRYSRPATRR
jgi:hypothetical protein